MRCLLKQVLVDPCLILRKNKSNEMRDGEKNSACVLREKTLTRTLAVRDFEGPFEERAMRATSAAVCSACLSVEQ